MSPNVYVDEAYFEEFDNEWNIQSQFNIYTIDYDREDKLKSLLRIRDLFLASTIYTDTTDKTVVKYFKKKLGTFGSMKDFILHSKISDSSYATRGSLYLNKKTTDCKKCNFCYFTNKEYDDCIQESKKRGSLFLGKNFLKSSFYLEHTFASQPTNELISQINRSRHPCNSLIIFDKYIFDDNHSRYSKIPNLISFLKELISSDLSGKFELDIVTENKFNNSLVKNKFNQILESFNDKLSLHVYAPSKIIQESDRYLITNYAIFSVGHPFDRHTHVSCNFYPSNNSVNDINISYKFWKDKIELVKNIIFSTPNFIGSQKSIWKSDDICHRLFDV